MESVSLVNDAQNLQARQPVKAPKPRSQFPTTLESRAPVPWTDPLPPIKTTLLPSTPSPSDLAPLQPTTFDSACPHPERAVAPLKRLQFAHLGALERNESTVFNPSAVLNGDHIYAKYAWIPTSSALIARAIFGERAQGPPGSCHGGSLFALLDDLIGVAGMMFGMGTTLDCSIARSELTFRPGEERGFEMAGQRNYLAMALDALDEDPAGAAMFSAEEIRGFREKREKRAPYSPEESRFILSVFGGTMRSLPGVPTTLVAGLSGKLKKRTPLLTELIAVARIVERRGRRVTIKAQILGTGDRESAWEPEVAVDGKTYGTVHAEAEGEAVILWARDAPKEKSKI